MASLQSEIEEKILTCSLCLNLLTDPKCLPCIHTFCKECLRSHIQHTATRGMIHCPECRETVWLQTGGVDAYRTNFFINRLMDMKIHKQSIPTEDSIPCSSHPGMNMTLFCELCNVCVCSECIVHNHKGHPCMGFGEARKEREKTLKNRLNDVEAATNAAKDMFRIQCKKKDNICQEQADVSDQMKSATRELIEGIETISSNTIRALGEATKPVLEKHADYLDELKTYSDQMDSDIANLRLTVDRSSDVEMLDAYKDTVDRASDICTKNFGNKEEALQKASSQLKTSYVDLFGKFASQCKELINQTKKDLCDNILKTKTTESKTPRFRRSFRGKSNISVSEAGSTPPKLSKKVKYGRPSNDSPIISGLCVHSKTGYLYCCVGDKAYRYGGLRKRWRDIHSKLNVGSRAVCDAQDAGDVVLFSVRSEGNNSCSLVKYNPASPVIEILDLSFVSELPGICVCPDNTILVTNFRRGAIHRVSWSGETLATLATNTLNKPWYISQTSTGKIVVSDSAGSDTFLLSSDGSFLKSLKAETISKGCDNTLCDPYAVRVDTFNRIFVACCWSNCIQVFSETGEYLTTVVSPDHEIIHPISLHLTDNKLFIGHKDGVTSYQMTT